MRITEEDRKLLGLIEAWGYLTVEDVCLMMGYKAESSAKWRLKRLVEAEEIRREKSILGKFIYCTKDFKRLDIAGYDHEQKLKRLAVTESKRLDCEYVTIRQLRSEARQELGIAGLTKKVPDFLLVKEGKTIAVELELSQKNLARQRANIDKHIDNLQQGEYRQVFYYCGSEAILQRVQQISAEKKMSQFISAVLFSGG